MINLRSGKSISERFEKWKKKRGKEYSSRSDLAVSIDSFSKVNVRSSTSVISTISPNFKISNKDAYQSTKYCFQSQRWLIFSFVKAFYIKNIFYGVTINVPMYFHVIVGKLWRHAPTKKKIYLRMESQEIYLKVKDGQNIVLRSGSSEKIKYCMIEIKFSKKICWPPFQDLCPDQ